jgi:putative membrane protein insertion efficiency factor
VKAKEMIPLQKEEDRVETARLHVSVRTALLALRFYKAYLSILFAGNCRFHPTCSQYAYEAIERFGVIRGIWLGLKRLLCCHPLSRKFGYDPVPESGKSTSLPRETGACGGLGTSCKESGLPEPPVTSWPRVSRAHESLRSIHSCKFETPEVPS